MPSVSFRRPPEDVSLGRLSQSIFDVLAAHTSFPWPVMQAQSRRVGADPANLTAADLAKLIEHLASAVGRFTSAEKAARVEQELRALV